MKKIIALVVCLMITTSVFAFDPGEKLIWGEVGFSSYTPMKDYDATTTLSLDAMVSYFLMKDISLDVGLFWESVKSPYYYYKSDETSTVSDLLIGVGGSFYITNFYVNAAFLYELYSSKYSSKDDDTYNQNATYLLFGGGYLVPLVEGVFIDIGADYMMGLGKFSGDSEADNERSSFGVGAGFVVHLP